MKPSWAERRAHQLRRPSRDGLAALANAVAPGSHVVRTRRLVGGLATGTHLVELSNGDKVVVKRYVPGDDKAPNEWARLRFVHRLPVPTPEPLAFDASGDWFGTPALVMRVLEGKPYVAPSDPSSFMEQIALMLANLHASRATRAPAAFNEEHAIDTWKARDGSTLTRKANDAIEQARPRAEDLDRVVTHGDFHPGNLLWSRGRLTGIIDWSHARLGPRAWDVAYCRADLAVLLGSRAPGLFLDAYTRAAGTGDLEHVRTFDLMCGLNAIRWGHLWTLAYNEQGAEGLTPAIVKRRATSFVRRCLTEG